MRCRVQAGEQDGVALAEMVDGPTECEGRGRTDGTELQQV